MHLSYCHLFGGQTVRVEQRPVVDSLCCLDRDSMAEGILFDTSVREVSLRKMSAVRDKWALISGVLNGQCETREGEATRIGTNQICRCSQYRCIQQGH